MLGPRRGCLRYITRTVPGLQPRGASDVQNSSQGPALEVYSSSQGRVSGAKVQPGARSEVHSQEVGRQLDGLAHLKGRQAAVGAPPAAEGVTQRALHGQRWGALCLFVCLLGVCSWGAGGRRVCSEVSRQATTVHRRAVVCAQRMSGSWVLMLPL